MRYFACKWHRQENIQISRNTMYKVTFIVKITIFVRKMWKEDNFANIVHKMASTTYTKNRNSLRGVSLYLHLPYAYNVIINFSQNYMHTYILPVWWNAPLLLFDTKFC